MDDLSFKHWFEERRKALDLTQAELAARIGCSSETIRKIEARVRRPSKDIAERLAHMLAGVPEERAALVRLLREPNSTKQSPLPGLSSKGQIDSSQPSGWRLRSRLPAPTTSLIGRDAQVAVLRQLLLREDVRLVTLTGPPGVGKTRLALQVAGELDPAFADGVAFVALAPLSEPHLLLATIAHGLGLREMAGQPLLERVLYFLYDRHLLLVLDNFEQLLDESPLISDLLAAAPRLKVLVTNRARLRLYGEHAFEVPPLQGLHLSLPYG